MDREEEDVINNRTKDKARKATIDNRQTMAFDLFPKTKETPKTIMVLKAVEECGLDVALNIQCWNSTSRIGSFFSLRKFL